ncbi:MAG TPA: hypothetical protein VJ044_03620, partial [Candidatus Hodarchaeales archaeon]|nr:hypothetical protein [Candidatus Hodarchaeales archaeon]
NFKEKDLSEFHNSDKTAGSKYPYDDNSPKAGIRKYFFSQIEKLNKQIQLCQYFLQDLVDRRAQLPLPEYFQMYESFSLKLGNLENERDSLLKQYRSAG